jgi:outer membrane protein assembly factor BamB
VVALSIKTGKTRWSLAVDGDADTGPALGPGGTIVLAAGKIVYALRPSGAVLWRFAAKKKVYASPAVAPDGTVYVGSQDDHLYAISSKGALIFRRDLGADIDCAAAIADDGTLYVGTDGGQVVALDPKGKIVWRADISGFVRGGLTIARDGTVLAGTYGPGPRVVALDRATAEVRWSFPIQGTGAAEFGIHGAPLEDADGNFYLGAQDDRIYSLDHRGQLRWSTSTGGDVDAPLLIGPGGVLYAGSYDGRVYALR